MADLADNMARVRRVCLQASSSSSHAVDARVWVAGAAGAPFQCGRALASRHSASSLRRWERIGRLLVPLSVGLLREGCVSAVPTSTSTAWRSSAGTAHGLPHRVHRWRRGLPSRRRSAREKGRGAPAARRRPQLCASASCCTCCTSPHAWQLRRNAAHVRPRWVD